MAYSAIKGAKGNPVPTPDVPKDIIGSGDGNEEKDKNKG